MKPLVLYVDPTLPKGMSRVSPLMYPLWNKSANDTISVKGAFTQHPFDATQYVSHHDPDACDCHFWPFNYWATKKTDAITHFKHARDNAQKHGKKLLVDAFGDTMALLPYDNIIVLRFAQYRRHLKSNDIILPAYIEDLAYTYRNGNVTVREKQEHPFVGFVGWAGLPFRKHFRTYVKEAPIRLLSMVYPPAGVYRKGVFMRSEALKVLQNSPNIETDFIIRNSYSGNIRTAEGDPHVLREEFVRNIENTDYTLCQKGDANQSTRFYEVLSMGRIPLVIDTECVFPLEDRINYTDFSVFVDYRDISHMGEILAQKHTQLSNEEFLDMQKKGRGVFEKYLRIDAFTKYLVEEVRRRITK